MDTNRFWQILQERAIEAEYNERYWHYLSVRLKTWDKWTRIGLAVLTSSSLGGLYAVKAQPEFFATITTLAAVFSTTILPLLRWQKIIPEVEADRARWVCLSKDYAGLVRDFEVHRDAEAVEKDFERLEEKRVTLAQTYDAQKDRRDLMDLAWAEVIARRTPAQA